MNITELNELYSALHTIRLDRDIKANDDDPRYQAWIREDKKKWTAESTLAKVESFIKEIDERNTERLITYNNGGFPIFWKLFAARTGVRVPASQKAILTMLRSYLGEANVDAYFKAQADQQAIEDEKDRIRGLKYQRDAIKEDAHQQIVGSQYGDEWIDELLTKGWEVETYQHGAVRRYRIANPTTGQRYPNTKDFKPLLEYARLVTNNHPACEPVAA